MAKKIWKARLNCIMPFGDFNAGESVELDDSSVDARVKACFECLTPEEVKAEAEAKKTDPDTKVMVERLKAAKIPMKRGITKEEIRKLFNDFLAASSTEVAGVVK